MKITTLSLWLLLTLSTSGKGQTTDTVFFDKDWNVTASRDFKYYRIVTKENDLFKMNDYFRSGEIQSIGYYRDEDLTDQTGPSYYFRKKGGYHTLELNEPSQYPQITSRFKVYLDQIPPQIDSFALSMNFNKKGKMKSIGYRGDCCTQHGTWLYFYWGALSEKINFANGQRNGPYVDYFDGTILREGQFKNDKKDGLWAYYTYQGELRKKVLFKEGKKIESAKIKQ